MDAVEIISDGLGRVRQSVQMALEGLDAGQLTYNPGTEANPVGWLVWHLTRVQDDHVSELAGGKQAWTGEGWHDRFNMAPDPHDAGTGDSAERVAAFAPPDASTLVAYHAAVQRRTADYLQTLSADDLDRILDEPQYDPMPTVGVRLVSVMIETAEHAGQVAYVRGLIAGRRWAPV